MTGFVATYEGEVRAKDGQLSNLALQDSWRSESPLRVVVTVRKDASGQELVEYRVGGKTDLVLFLDSTGQIEKRPKEINLRPVEQAAGPIGIGFLLPPTASRTFLKTGKGSNIALEKGCGKAEKGCVDVDMPLGFSSNVLHGMYRPGERRVVWHYNQRDTLEWKFEFDKGPLPSVIRYVERSSSGDLGVKASATFRLTSYKQVSEPLSRDAVVSKNQHVQVFKGDTGYGPITLDEDPWQRYREQDQKWSQLEKRQKEGTQAKSWLPSAGMALALVLVLGFYAYKRIRSAP